MVVLLFRTFSVLSWEVAFRKPVQIGEEEGDAPAASQSLEHALTINTAADAPASWAWRAVPNSPMISSTGSGEVF